MGLDPRTPYAVEADRALERGEWLFAEVKRQRGAELAMRAPEEWELERTGWTLVDGRWWYWSPHDVTLTGFDLAFSRGDIAASDGVRFVVVDRDVDAGTITVTAIHNPVVTTITLASELPMPMPRHLPQRSRVPRCVQQNRPRLDGRRA